MEEVVTIYEFGKSSTKPVNVLKHLCLVPVLNDIEIEHTVRIEYMGYRLVLSGKITETESRKLLLEFLLNTERLVKLEQI
jgi:hypothetical protein